MTIRDMVARQSPKSERDFIPTPPFATRALYEHVLLPRGLDPVSHDAWDPAGGHGHMARVMGEMGHYSVRCTDLWPSHEHGVSEMDFLAPTGLQSDLIVTNPPYKHLQEFIQLSLDRASRGVAMLIRVQGLEGMRRYNAIYNPLPPTTVAFFSDRIPFKQGKVVQKAPKMFFHCWVWWDLECKRQTEAIWITPTVQKDLERSEDYD